MFPVIIQMILQLEFYHSKDPFDRSFFKDKLFGISLTEERFGISLANCAFSWNLLLEIYNLHGGFYRQQKFSAKTDRIYRCLMSYTLKLDNL